MTDPSPKAYTSTEEPPSRLVVLCCLYISYLREELDESYDFLSILSPVSCVSFLNLTTLSLPSRK